jgi:nucleotide-binding universal stress UspA family protein
MFHRILVGLDHSDLGERVFNEALALAQASEGSLRLVHVLCPGAVDYPQMPSLSSLEYYPGLDGHRLELYGEQWRLYAEQGLAMGRAQTIRAMAAGVPTDFLQITGSPGHLLCDAAQSWEADLMLVGRRGHVGVQEFLLGSVSNYVLHHAPCSVLVINREPDTAAVDTKQLGGDRTASTGADR